MINNRELENKLEIARSGKYKICAWGAGYVGKGAGYKILAELGIRIDFYCDRDPALHGTEIIDGIRCIAPDDIPKDTICFIMTGLNNSPDIRAKLSGFPLKYVIDFSELCEYKSKNLWDCQKKNQIVVYTCVVDGYDEVQEPAEAIPNCDFYLISDKKKENSIYQYIDIDDIEECRHLDNTRKNRYCKINAHKLFPNYRYSIYFDGYAVLYSAITKYIEQLPKTRIIGLYRQSNTVYAEAAKQMLLKRDKEEKFIRQVEKYWNEGFPEDFGVIGPGLLIRQHNHPICRKLMEDWWDEVLTFSNRDMLSLPYVLWKNGYTIEDVGVCSKQMDIPDVEGHIWPRDHKKPRHC